MAISTVATMSLIEQADLIVKATDALTNAGFDAEYTRNALNAMFTPEQPVATMPVVTTKPRKVTQTKPATKRTPARKAAEVKSAPNMRLTTDGRMMNAEDGTATKNQVARNIAFAEKHGFIVEDFASFSMADASDWYADAKSAL